MRDNDALVGPGDFHPSMLMENEAWVRHEARYRKAESCRMAFCATPASLARPGVLHGMTVTPGVPQILIDCFGLADNYLIVYFFFSPASFCLELPLACGVEVFHGGMSRAVIQSNAAKTRLQEGEMWRGALCSSVSFRGLGDKETCTNGAWVVFKWPVGAS